MARFKVAVTKSVPFQGSGDEFSNVYTYETGITDPDFNQLADAIVAAEKLVFASLITFLRVQVWDAGLPPNTMRLSKAVTGQGAASATAGAYRECALLVKWPLPPSTSSGRARQRSLKKWLHTSNFGSVTQMQGDTAYASTAAIPGLAGYISAITNPISGGATLTSDSGAEPSGPAVLHPYLEHRQFPRGRKQT